MLGNHMRFHSGVFNTCALERWLNVTVFALALSVPYPALAQDGGWIPKSPMPTPREKIASCAIGKYLYVVGGAGIELNPGLDTNERYNTASDTWTGRRAMPTARLSLTAAAVDGQCFVIGGQPTTLGPVLSLVEAYDPSTNKWTARTDMPTPRFLAASAVIDGIIYVVGGAQGAFTVGTLEAYDPANDTWTSLRPMPDALAAVAATALDGKLYVMGGTNNPVTHRSAAGGGGRLDCDYRGRPHLFYCWWRDRWHRGRREHL